MNRILFPMLITIVFALVGCGRAKVSSGTAPAKEVGKAGVEASADVFPDPSDTNDVMLNGLKIHYPKSLKDMKVGMNDSDLTLTFREFSVEVRDGRVFVDGKDYGTVSKGGEVLLGSTGEIMVDGQVRNPL